MPESDLTNELSRQLVATLLESSGIHVETSDLDAVVHLRQIFATPRRVLATVDPGEYEPVPVFKVHTERQLES